MFLVYHGGNCCGVRHVYSMGADPTSLILPKKASEPFNSQRPYVVQNLYTRERPAETRLQRLEAYLEFQRAEQDAGIIEIILSSNQAVGWHDSLIALGFKEVSRHRNSNSGNDILIYHLCYGE